MTDLEKLAAELARRVHKNMERRFGYEVAFENETDTAAHFAEIIVEATEDARKQAYHSGFDSGREVGRIEGLKEAMRNVCILCREGKAISDDHFHPMIMAIGQIHYELCQASRIHAIVRELEGEK